MGWYTSITWTLLAALVPITVVISVVILRRFVQHRIERKGYPLPPGPTPLPLLGNLLSVNPQRPWLTCTEWQAKYGDIIYIRLFDTDAIVLNSMSIATELLEKRSRIYSDRPFLITVEPYGRDSNIVFRPYGEHWRLSRRIFQQTFRADALLKFHPMQLRKARELICNIMDDPDEYYSHLHTFTNAVAMSAVCDYEPIPRNDPMVLIVNNYVHASVPGLIPTKLYLVKMFPFLLHIPDWLPGSWIRREAKEGYKWSNKINEVPYQYVRKRMESNDDVDTAMIPDHIVRMEKLSGSHRSAYETALKHACATTLFSLAESIPAISMTFLLAMVQNPHVWKRAHVEIDTVVGTETLIEFTDRVSLPYVDAILRETLRWKPLAPIVAPHMATSNDVYKGYYIPKGASILVNAWAISRDETRYPDAEKFIPERFLDEEGRLTDDDPGEFIFGFGRRRCAGVHIADASLWSAIATMLATLDFNLAKDADGNDVTFEATFANGMGSYHPNPFPCRLTPRVHVNKEVLRGVLPSSG